MTYRYSFSSLARVERCPCSALLQQVDETSGYALDGRRKHSYLERAATVGRDAALAELPDDEREAAAAIDLAAMPWLQSGAAEGAFALDLEHGTARELGRGLAAFADELDRREWQRTVVVVISEFGRTVRENGGRGTDHGHGSVYWVLGGGLRPQAVAGEQVAVDAAHLFQNRDLPVLNDYRAVLGGLLARQFGLGAAALQTVFPGARPRDLGLV